MSLPSSLALLSECPPAGRQLHLLILLRVNSASAMSGSDRSSRLLAAMCRCAGVRVCRCQHPARPQPCVNGSAQLPHRILTPKLRAAAACSSDLGADELTHTTAVVVSPGQHACFTVRHGKGMRHKTTDRPHAVPPGSQFGCLSCPKRLTKAPAGNL